MRVNAKIRCREVFVIGDDGEQLGTMSPEEGLQLALEADLDLVEVSPNATPPVCRIMDYGKHLYDEKKKSKKTVRLDIKEIRVRPKTGKHDIEVKIIRARKFLRKGHKVQLTMLLRGREKAHPDRARGVLTRVAEMLMDMAKIEMEPRMNHNRLGMLFAPDKSAIARLDATRKKEAEEAEAEKEAESRRQAAPEVDDEPSKTDEVPDGTDEAQPADEGAAAAEAEPAEAETAEAETAEAETAEAETAEAGTAEAETAEAETAEAETEAAAQEDVETSEEATASTE